VLYNDCSDEQYYRGCDEPQLSMPPMFMMVLVMMSMFVLVFMMMFMLATYVMMMFV
jgi:hypothetical protein